jgi:hypothetical protein
MAKPSLKNKLSADKIEEANRLLVAQNTPVKPSPTEGGVSETPMAKVKETKPAVQKTIKKTATKTPVKTVRKNVEPPFIEKRLVRVTIDIPEDVHEKLKIKMILTKQTIKEYILNFIERDISKSDFKF